MTVAQNGWFRPVGAADDQRSPAAVAILAAHVFRLMKGGFMSVAPSPIFLMARKSVTWSILLSVLLIVAGMLAIIVPAAAGLAVTILLGWLLIFSGVTHLVFAWHTRGARSILWEILVALVYLVIGIYLLWNPGPALVSLTLALAIYLFAEAVLEFILAFRLRPMAGSSWLLVDGILTLILAIMIWRTWPASGPWAIGILVGISMIFSGVARLMLSMTARSLLDKMARA